MEGARLYVNYVLFLGRETGRFDPAMRISFSKFAAQVRDQALSCDHDANA